MLDLLTALVYAKILRRKTLRTVRYTAVPAKKRRCKGPWFIRAKQLKFTGGMLGLACWAMNPDVTKCFMATPSTGWAAWEVRSGRVSFTMLRS